MIPKIIHYCWFGGKPKPELAEKCIASWKKHLPDYKYIEWNEDNFDFEKFPYAKEALEAKKYAYITDVVRLYVLREFGGIYMDTDVEVLKPLDIFLKEPAFSGFESNKLLPTGIMGAEKNSVWASEMLEYYNGRSFLSEKNQPILIPNTIIITDMMEEKGFSINNTFQKKEGYVTFYPSEYFCPKDYISGKIYITENTYCIHHFSGSWLPRSRKVKDTILRFIDALFGRKASDLVSDIYAKIKK
ncbi:glycosyl transferase [Capnocytophaga stomatis]|uniref:glycosyltransferase family 32 protein n=1 Tax=Capnocytophaga stomatis TaxID=1848904 RepID=UPI00194EC328|nr:glycosyltransferase [Capnocytophaga stomatis]GIJ97805.1 glycosyl transferase [Capnocytophaga stomatis]GIM48733.1 glycosyl transferase [Capnocytophaga stomatis]